MTGKVPTWHPPTLATLTEDRFSDPDWIYERKLDGVRCLAFRNGRRVRLLSRNRQSLNGTYPEIVEALAAQTLYEVRRRWRDRRIRGTPHELRPAAGQAGSHRSRGSTRDRHSVFYYMFDLIHLDAGTTTDLPLSRRKRLLRDTFQFTDPLRYTTHRVKNGEAAYTAACRRGDEGVIAKRADAPYEGRRSANWLKFKCSRDQEFVIVGYTAPKGSRVGLGALLLGYYDGDELSYAGKVGTGFDTATLRSLHKRLSRTERKKPPVTLGRVNVPGAHWVRPTSVAQVAFSEWTRDGKLRHPRYLGLRTDKSPGDVVRESR